MIGKAIDTITDAKYADMIIDELEVWTADRQTLLDYNFIQRGRLVCDVIGVFCKPAVGETSAIASAEKHLVVS